MKKIFIFFICGLLLVSSFVVPASAAGSYTEYYQYNGQAISTAVSDVLAGYAINSIRQFPEYYRYWFSFRLDEYRYAIVLMPNADCYKMNTSTMIATVNDGIMIVYNQRLASYTTGTNYNQTYYQAGLEPTTIYAPLNIQFTRGFVVGNIADTINVHPEYESVLYFEYIKYILYTLVIFLLLFVSFKFLNKRWLLP